MIATGYGVVITKYTAIKKVVVQPFAGGEAWPSHMQSGNVNFGQHCAFQIGVVRIFRPVGACSTLAAGHMGDEQVTTQNLEIVRVDAERNLLLIKGAVPGAPGGHVTVRPSVKVN